ncbi:hypothetical protein PTKIN_Ptkin19aG0090800 [Pterospermum kingtungense]
MLNETVLLRFKYSSQVVHAFVSGAYIGTENDRYIFEKNISLSPGNNLITLLSITVGLAHFGYEFDLHKTGILGPVELIMNKGNQTTVKNLTSNKWSYKVGMDGLTNKIFETNVCKTVKWASDSVPINRNFTWYKTTFKAPLGKEPVVLDLLGLGKGIAWVNGHDIGRYWRSAIPDMKLCSHNRDCDYRGSFEVIAKCKEKCGEPTQRW